MPVRKFHDVSEMESGWLDPDDPRLIRAIRSVWAYAQHLPHVVVPPGVHKYRSIEELNDADDRREREAARMSGGAPLSAPDSATRR